MKRPLAYITAAWGSDDKKNTSLAVSYCRKIYDAGFSPICPVLHLPLFLDASIPQEHKDGIDICTDLLRRSSVLVVCGEMINESMRTDIAVANRYRITATTLDGILTVRRYGQKTKGR
jgi:hypothetical protein